MSFQSRLGVKRKLGQALYGAVYLCEDGHRNNELVAVKEVNLRDAKRKLSLNRHMDNPWQERNIAEQLTELGPHPHILHFHDSFMDNGSWYSIMEYCNGGDLLTYLQDMNDGRVSEPVALDLLRQVARGLQHLHSNGIAHRDLSLENVLIHNGTCKLSDFGLSTEADRLCNECVGKAYYMAPEIVAHEEYDPKAADMWALGMMVFILLTGSPLVPMASASDKAFLALKTFGVSKILNVWGMTSCISQETVDLLEMLLDVNPTKRPTVEELLAHPVKLP